jgi:Zn-dependent protease
MIFRLLNDVKIAHYLSARENQSEDTAKIANFGVLFISLLGFYGAILILGIGVTYKFTGVLFKDMGILANALLIFGPYIAIYFGLINPKLCKSINREDYSETEIKSKKKVLLIYKICCVLAVPIAMLIVAIL